MNSEIMNFAAKSMNDYSVCMINNVLLICNTYIFMCFYTYIACYNKFIYSFISVLLLHIILFKEGYVKLKQLICLCDITTALQASELCSDCSFLLSSDITIFLF